MLLSPVRRERDAEIDVAGRSVGWERSSCGVQPVGGAGMWAAEEGSWERGWAWARGWR